MSRVLCWLGWHDERVVTLVERHITKMGPAYRGARCMAGRCRRCGKWSVIHWYGSKP